MKTSFLLILALVVVSFSVSAMEPPVGQIHIDANKVLRGRFSEEHQLNGVNQPLLSSGHFVVAPSNGFIWGIEQPFPTSTIITSTGAAQDFGGMAVKLPIRNLRHLYDIIGGALAGDWSGLEADFTMTHSGNGHHWQRSLTPRPNNKANLTYTVITVSGGRFVEDIVMTKADASHDAFHFTDVSLSQAPLAARETALFHEVMP